MVNQLINGGACGYKRLSILKGTPNLTRDFDVVKDDIKKGEIPNPKITVDIILGTLNKTYGFGVIYIMGTLGLIFPMLPIQL